MTDNTINAVWQKATPIAGLNPDMWRLDINGRLICRNEYGKTTPHGWEIDHSLPKSREGSDDISNLFPMRWRENREKSNKTQQEYVLNEFIKNLRESRAILATQK